MDLKALIKSDKLCPSIGPIYLKPRSSNKLPGVKEPFKAFSDCLIKN